jgi:ABC-2 type transport system permease protein
MVSAWSAALGIVLREIGSLAAVVTGLQLPLTLTLAWATRTYRTAA